MSTMIKERLLDNGLMMINKKSTRNGSILDHFYTNNIEKIEEIKIEDDTNSDHSMIIVKRRMKINNIEETVIITRKYKDINYDEINENILNNENYNNLLTETDTDVIANQLIQFINNEMDNQSKERKVKIKEKKVNKYTKETIDLIDRKNIIYKEWKENKTIENKNNLKNIKQLIKTIKNREDFINKKKKK